MAFLDATQWNDWQDVNAKSDQRFSSKGVIDSFKSSTQFVDYISPSAKEKFATFSSLRDVQIPVIKEQTVTVVTTPGFNFIPDNLTESDVFTFAAVDFFSGFRHYPAMYQNNQIDAEFDRNVKMTNVSQAIADEIETYLVTILDANKSQVIDFTTQVNQSSGGGVYTFNGGTDTLEINKAAQQETMFTSLSTLMTANKLPGSYMSVVSPAGLAVQKLEALKFGAANDKNIQAIGMIPAEDMHNSHNIAQGSDVFNGFWVRKGSVGLYENFPWDFRNGTTTGNGEQWSVTDVELPFARVRANIYTNTFSANATGLVTPNTDSNLIMSAGEEMAVWVRIYATFPYNTDITTRANDIVKIKGLTT